MVTVAVIFSPTSPFAGVTSIFAFSGAVYPLFFCFVACYIAPHLLFLHILYLMFLLPPYCCHSHLVPLLILYFITPSLEVTDTFAFHLFQFWSPDVIELSVLSGSVSWVYCYCFLWYLGTA